ncbi:hypothetical protein BCV69DRAFT_147776 [Microstroma glucosiphilum]|uniref:F-box domain-containing protein n=1 Tax=Pseudomicrostroma glucosiphilum TaxID=1684307 RepID=A0A316UCL5_9BASI|nr:hypothetical protein BCV69DRAFT_147776 [Pseudomicrostroma glucosiphilum]PWN22574.1 hypothetical protein BCV69DRAFT_147776 [Pseudomicrostroma glucosiphilum]
MDWPSHFPPDEILFEIWLHVDDPWCLTWTSRRLYAFSKQTHLRSLWLLQQYGEPYAMFHAIARSKMFDPELFRDLLASGATLSLAIVQELAKRQFSDVNNKPMMALSYMSWGKGISFEAALAVVTEGRRRQAMTSRCDSLKYQDWLFGTQEMLESQLEELFCKHQFAPLPLLPHWQSISQSEDSWVKESAMDKAYSKIRLVVKYMQRQREYNAAKRRLAGSSESTVRVGSRQTSSRDL